MGTSPLLMNNPQTVDPFNKFSKLKKPLTSKKQKTEEDLIELGNLDVESKLYFDELLGVYVPATWLTEAIITTAFAVAKIGRNKMRGGLFATEPKIPLTYGDMKDVKRPSDVVYNQKFRHRMILPQQNVRIAKDAPIFHDWSFTTVIEFDDKIVDFPTLKRIVEHAAKYGGFGDFRPTFGRAVAEVMNHG